MKTWTSTPVTLGPATNENARLPFSSEVASRYWSRWTIDWKSDAFATPKTTLNVPTRRATAYSCHKVSTSAAYAIGTETRTAARPTSAAIIVPRRRPRRSTQAPAGSEKSRYGNQPAAVR